MRLTLLRAKEAFRNKAAAENLDFRLNRVCERLLLHGKFAGSLIRLAIRAPYGQLTLPRRFRTVEGVKVDSLVYELANHWYEFLPGKGNPKDFALDSVRDLGDGWAVMHTPQPPAGSPAPTITTLVTDFPQGLGSISVSYPGPTNYPIKIEGQDEDEVPQELNFTASGQSFTNPFARITRISTQRSAVRQVVTFTNTDSAQTVLAIISPSEEETYYRRYLIDIKSQEANAIVECLAKRRHIEFTSDDDILPFSNVSAIGLGLDALQHEDEDDHTLADQIWNKAVDILNKELKDTNAENTMPGVRFFYPGHSTPNLRSHY